jgi:ribosomal protein S18 acetylase RimI-like enzyme
MAARFEIRAAEPADAAGIAAVVVASWQVAYRGLLPDEVLAGLSVAEREQFWSGVLTGPAPRSAVLVAEIGAAGVVGFAAVGPSTDPAATADDGQLYAIYLLPQDWGRGLGSQLHSAALRRLGELDFRRAYLWALETNERAIAFYEKAGWVVDGARQIEEGPAGVELPEIRLRRDLLRS